MAYWKFAYTRDDAFVYELIVMSCGSVMITFLPEPHCKVQMLVECTMHKIIKDICIQVERELLVFSYMCVLTSGSCRLCPPVCR
jgi:hypothetical protein